MFLCGVNYGLYGESDLWSIVEANADRVNPFPYELDLYGVYEALDVPVRTPFLIQFKRDKEKGII